MLGGVSVASLTTLDVGAGQARDIDLPTESLPVEDVPLGVASLGLTGGPG